MQSFKLARTKRKARLKLRIGAKQSRNFTNPARHRLCKALNRGNLNESSDNDHFLQTPGLARPAGALFQGQPFEQLLPLIDLILNAEIGQPTNQPGGWM